MSFLRQSFVVNTSQPSTEFQAGRGWRYDAATMTDPDNTVNRTLRAERITGIRGGTGATGQQGIGYAYYNVKPAARLLAAAILWAWRHVVPRRGLR
jgi:hypothetical protein